MAANSLGAVRIQWYSHPNILLLRLLPYTLVYVAVACLVFYRCLIFILFVVCVCVCFFYPLSRGTLARFFVGSVRLRRTKNKCVGKHNGILNEFGATTVAVAVAVVAATANTTTTTAYTRITHAIFFRTTHSQMFSRPFFDRSQKTF